MRRTSQNLHITDGLRADPSLVRQMAQKLLDAMDGMMWALQNMPDGDDLRNSLVRCKSELGRSLESIGYTLKVRPGFKTVVTKIRQPRRQEPTSMAASAATRIIISSRCPYGDTATEVHGWCTCDRCQRDRERWTADQPPLADAMNPGDAEDAI